MQKGNIWNAHPCHKNERNTGKSEICFFRPLQEGKLSNEVGASKVSRTERNRFCRWMKEAIEIRKRAPKTVNQNEGAYQISHTWDTVLRATPGRSTNHQAADMVDNAIPPQVRWQNPYKTSQTTSPQYHTTPLMKAAEARSPNLRYKHLTFEACFLPPKGQ